LGKGPAIEAFNTRFNDFGFWSVLVAGVTPFPFKVITIMSGWTSLPLDVFIGTSLIARALRFFVVAALLVEIRPADPRFHREAAGVDVHAVRGSADRRLLGTKMAVRDWGLAMLAGVGIGGAAGRCAVLSVCSGHGPVPIVHLAALAASGCGGSGAGGLVRAGGGSSCWGRRRRRHRA
jgi:hypothetical protein